MSDIDKLLRQIPIGDIAHQLGVSKAEAKDGAAKVLPALLSGLQANARNPKGEASLLEALKTKDTGLLDGGISLGAVDVADGQKIVQHIFGKSTPDVAARLGGVSLGGTSLIQKLLPLLAPIVMVFLAKKALDKKTSSSGGGLGDLIGGMLGGSGGGGVLGGILGGLGGLFGGGAEESEPKTTTKSKSKSKPKSKTTTRKKTTKKSSSSKSSGGSIGDLLGDLLGGGTH